MPRTLRAGLVAVAGRIVSILVLSVLSAPLVPEAQPPSKIPRVGIISEYSPPDPFHPAFRQGLLELGYVEGRNIVIEYRYAHAVSNRVPGLAVELIDLGVDVLVVGGTVSAQSAKAVTTTVPIVFTLAGDPVGSGLVTSLARPGGNVTGTTSLSIHSDLSGKQLELLKLAVPQISRVAVLYNPVNPVTASALNGMRKAARALAVEVQLMEVRLPDELPSAFSLLAAGRPGAVLALSDPVFGGQLPQLAALAARNRLPSMYARKEFVEAGGLLSYGASFSENYRRAAGYVDRILKGAKPADLPVEQPTKFELVINLKTARALGLTVSPSVLGQADRVIE